VNEQWGLERVASVGLWVLLVGRGFAVGGFGGLSKADHEEETAGVLLKHEKERKSLRSLVSYGVSKRK
jgi:hypothetical protein